MGVLFWGLRFRVSGFELRFSGFGCWGFGSRVSGIGFRVSVFCFMFSVSDWEGPVCVVTNEHHEIVEGSGGVSGVEFRVQGLRCRVWT